MKTQVREIVDRHSDRHGALMLVLQDIQDQYGYLPENALKQVSAQTNRSLVEIYGVATFYHAFTLKPRGKHLIAVCLGTACHVRGASRIADEFERRLSIKAGETTEDRQFTLQTVNCLGACALGPIVVTDGRYWSNVQPQDVDKIIASTQVEEIEIQEPVLAADQR